MSTSVRPKRWYEHDAFSDQLQRDIRLLSPRMKCRIRLSASRFYDYDLVQSIRSDDKLKTHPAVSNAYEDMKSPHGRRPFTAQV